MKQKLFLIVCLMAIMCVGLCSSAYATTMVDLDGAKMRFFFDDSDGINDADVKLKAITKLDQWNLLGFNEINWGFYHFDGDDVIVEPIYDAKTSNGGVLIPDTAFTFFDEDLIGDVAKWDGSGLFETTQGDYNFVYSGSDLSGETGWVEYKITTKAFNPVPEPATLMLFGVGLLGVAGVSRKKTHT